NQSCVGSACSCPQGQKICGGVCTDITQNNLSCGDCTTACPGSQYCNAGLCQSEFTCQSTFNPASAVGCSYFPLDSTACGAATQTAQFNFTNTLNAGT